MRIYKNILLKHPLKSLFLALFLNLSVGRSIKEYHWHSFFVFISYCFFGGYVMNAIDLTPLYRNSIGFDRLASLFDSNLTAETVSANYPPYNIEVLEENRYAITLAVAGFTESDIDITVEKSVLKISGHKTKDKEHDSQKHKYLHQGIANRSFERKFNLADYVKVTSANLSNGLLTIALVREIPEAMKPKTIVINQDRSVLEHSIDKSEESDKQKAA
jgi:molecular chaperone IbpA